MMYDAGFAFQRLELRSNVAATGLRNVVSLGMEFYLECWYSRGRLRSSESWGGGSEMDIRHAADSSKR